MAYNYPAFISIIDEFIKIAHEDLGKFKHVNIICRGLSGAVVATMFYNAIKSKYSISATICHLKKNNEESHTEDVTGLVVKNNSLYLWVDDFIESGSTIIECHQVISDFMLNKHNKTGFLFDYSVCATIVCRTKKIENITKNIVYNFK